MLGQRSRTTVRRSAVTAGVLLGWATVGFTPAWGQDAALPVTVATTTATSWLDIGTLGGEGAQPTALNNNGDVVGFSDTADGSQRAFRWRNGVMTDLSPGVGSNATAINDRGDIVGWVIAEGFHTHAALWRHGRLIDLGTLGGYFAAASGINARGDVIGTSSIVGDESQYGFWWRDGALKRLPAGGNPAFPTDINDNGDIVGAVTTSDGLGSSAAMWRRGRLVKLTPTFGDPNSALATEVNNNGDVLGQIEVPGSGWHTFLLSRGCYTDLGAAGPVDLNDRGEAVVLDSSLPPSIATRWYRGTGTRLPTLGPPDTDVSDLNNRGQIVGNLPGPAAPHESHAVLWTARNDVIDLGPLEGRVTMINEDGLMVGYINVPDGGVRTVVNHLAAA